MTHLNPEFARDAFRRSRLQGPDRALDALIGLIILTAEVLIGLLVLGALYEYGAENLDSGTRDAIAAGFAIALFGSIIPVAISTLIFLIRLARGRRSWTAPFWGSVFMAVALAIGFAIMAG